MILETVYFLKNMGQSSYTFLFVCTANIFFIFIIQFLYFIYTKLKRFFRHEKIGINSFTHRVKELSFCNKLKFSISFKFRLFELTVIVCLKYQRFLTFGCRDIWIKNSKFMARTQFLKY